MIGTERVNRWGDIGHDYAANSLFAEETFSPVNIRFIVDYIVIEYEEVR